MEGPLKPGDVLAGRYRVERVLGAGGMGVVAMAQHLLLGERVAVKCLRADLVDSGELLARFQREAKAAAKIQSEHVARVMDFGVLDSGAPFLVMEFLEGHDLAEELRTRGPLPVEEAVEYVLQASVGVAGAHALGIVHRDLKPQNLFLARLPNGRSLVKVLDFGIAKQTGAGGGTGLTGSLSILGSVAYMSPEQLRESRDVDARTDVWALGVVLFELLTGELPFAGESTTGMIISINSDPPHALRTLRPDAPKALESVILRCLEKDREKRFPSLSELAAALVPFGGRRSAVFADRVAGAFASERPGRPDPSGAMALGLAATAAADLTPPVEPPRTPTWARTTGMIVSLFVRSTRADRQRRIWIAAASVAIIATIAWAVSRDTATEPPPAATMTSVPEPVTAPVTPATTAEPQAASLGKATPAQEQAAQPPAAAEPAPKPTAAEPTPSDTPRPAASRTRETRRARTTTTGTPRTTSTYAAPTPRPSPSPSTTPTTKPRPKLKGPVVTDL